MSHAVVRGDPCPAQLYLDGILNEVLISRGKPLTAEERRKVSLAQILFHSLKRTPDQIFMINGSTGEKITRRQILKDAVLLAQILISKGVRGKTVTLIMRNHQRMTAMYLAVVFAEALPFMQDPSTTVFELTHYLELIRPTFVFCDEEHKDNLQSSLKKTPGLNTEIVVFEKEEHMKAFVQGYNPMEELTISDSDPEAAVLMLPTSGSTGLPKAALLTNYGLVAQLPILWIYHTQFPQPTELMMVLTTLQWATFTMCVTSAMVYDVPLLISPRPTAVDVVKDMLLRFRPTWTFFGPAFVKTLIPEVTSDHFSSMETVTLLGAPSTPELMNSLQELLPNTAHLCNGFGATEAQGFIAIPDREAPIMSSGRVINILHYKMVDENGKEIGLCQSGELVVKGTSIKGYYKNQEAYDEVFFDGWYKTGDLFYIDENRRLLYVERRKFSFKFRGCQVAPEEVESVISSVPGVQECVVCESEEGPAAAVVLRSGCDVSRREIHAAVNASLSEHKCLHGGISFVSSLPHTHTGKLHRSECKKLIYKLIENGECS